MKYIVLLLFCVLFSSVCISQHTDTLYVNNNSNTPLYVAVPGVISSITVGNRDSYIYQISPRDSNVALFLATQEAPATSILIKYRTDLEDEEFFSGLIAYKELPSTYFKDLRILSRSLSSTLLPANAEVSTDSLDSSEEILEEKSIDTTLSSQSPQALLSSFKDQLDNEKRMFYSVGLKKKPFIVQLENLTKDEENTFGCAKIKIRNLNSISYGVENIDILHIGNQVDKYYQRKRAVEILSMDVPSEIGPKSKPDGTADLFLVFGLDFLENTDQESELIIKVRLGRKTYSLNIGGKDLLKIFG